MLDNSEHSTAKLRKSYRSVRVSLVRETCVAGWRNPPTVRNGSDVAALAYQVIGSPDREHFIAIYLDGRHRVIAVHVAHVGTANSCPVHPREVLLPGVHLSAGAFVIAHNHPSGDPSPSDQDRSLTERMRKAGELIGIECLDHVVLGEHRFYSFADERFHSYAGE